MKKALLFAAAAAATTLGAGTASAVTVVPTCTTASCTVEIADTILSTGNFTSTFTFTFPQMGTASSGLINGGLTATSGNIDFSSVTLNGTPFPIILNTATFSLANLPPTPNSGGLQTLVVNGFANGPAAYGGNVTQMPGAVPEPATWAMMIGGFGMVGGAMRSSRRRQKGVLATA